MQCGGLDFSCSIASCAVNDPTEDNYAVLASDSISLYAVFDGHGRYSVVSE
jgi:serine/threonine protein phosphatase PrpC